jgi:hypothetical protein
MAGHHRNMGNKRGTGKFGFAGFRLRNSQLCVCAGKSNFFRVHLYLALAAVFQRVLMATLEAAAANPDPHALPGNGFNIVLFAAAVLLAFNPPTEIQHLHPAFQRDPTVVLIWLTKLRYKAAAAVLWVNAGGEIALRPGTSVADQSGRHRAGNLLHRHGNQEVVAPSAVDVQIALEQAFLPETHFGEHPSTGRILRADRGLNPVQHHRPDAVVQSKSQRAGRHAASGDLTGHPVPDPGRPQCAVGDVSDCQLAGEPAVDLNHIRQHASLAGLGAQA